MTAEPIRTLDQALLSAWQDELKATPNPIIKEQCLQQEPDLLPRFAEHYQQRKALRRRMRRSLQRQWKRSLAGVALLIALGQAPALAATLNVGGACTLIRAIVAANNDTATPGCKKGSGADTIVLPLHSTQTLTTVNNTNYGPTGLPTVRTPITIMGNGSTIRRAKSAPSFHIFSVAQAGKLTLQKAIVSGSQSKLGQGALYNYGGTVNVVSSTISGNTGCGINNHYYYNDQNRSGRVTISNSTISGNTGCGIGTFYTKSLTVTNSTISHNQGDGLLPDTTSARITGSTISGNGGSGLCRPHSDSHSTASGRRRDAHAALLVRSDRHRCRADVNRRRSRHRGGHRPCAGWAGGGVAAHLLLPRQ